MLIVHTDNSLHNVVLNLLAPILFEFMLKGHGSHITILKFHYQMVPKARHLAGTSLCLCVCVCVCVCACVRASAHPSVRLEGEGRGGEGRGGEGRGGEGRGGEGGREGGRLW